MSALVLVMPMIGIVIVLLMVHLALLCLLSWIENVLGRARVAWIVLIRSEGNVGGETDEEYIRCAVLQNRGVLNFMTGRYTVCFWEKRKTAKAFIF